MKFVLQLRGPKKLLTRPATRSWRQVTRAVSAMLGQLLDVSRELSGLRRFAPEARLGRR